ncbi:MAG: DUF262 domain-containing protein [Bacteroidia bacterium]|nr:DUF262 domain-containing protein [Bacteroidia bacterium]MBP9179429.1 DUF262 domain-containing protein [Bacteroidia bacterium]MBP9723708.1 DUF262 domain-containing protein [Bacteroidia bacterium]
MNNEEIPKNIPFEPIRYLLGKSFVVKDYQRGYKWEKKEVLDLLNDIGEHDEADGRYCLQPIIVREPQGDSDILIELIDGQQRLTTIYLILAYLNGGIPNSYFIDYNTRLESAEFLKNHIPDLHEAVVNQKNWGDFISQIGYERFNNVDVLHFYLVYNEVHNWFKSRNQELFSTKLLNVVHIIWYDLGRTIAGYNQSSEELFLNLNAGKIPLTSAELIKGLFILNVQDATNKELAKLKAKELAMEWDQIENKLHDDTFWLFICNKPQYTKSDTRIDYIFDLINGKSERNDYELFSFRIYSEKYRQEKVKADNERLIDALNWKEVKNTFNKLNEWYEDKFLYHYVGYLVVSCIADLSDILKLSKGLTKKAFMICLLDLIKEEFRKTYIDEGGETQLRYHVNNLNYEDFRKECQNALLLMNVQYYTFNGSSNKFPFDLYKKENWSVEHINPQNPRSFDTAYEIRKWLESSRDYYQGIGNPLAESIETVLQDFERIEYSDDRKLSALKLSKERNETIDRLIEDLTDDLDLHGISNLALLDRITNSRLGNKPFLDKRAMILEIDSGEESFAFIPVLTKNVFVKIYTKDSQSLTNSFFGHQDMEDYCSFIGSQLRKINPELETKNA